MHTIKEDCSVVENYHQIRHKSISFKISDQIKIISDKYPIWGATRIKFNQMKITFFMKRYLKETRRVTGNNVFVRIGNSAFD